MIKINLNEAKQFIQATGAIVGSYLGKAVIVIQANPVAVVAAIIVIAAVIIGVKCYQAYMTLKLENKKLSEINKEFADEINNFKQKATDNSKKFEEVVKENASLKSKILLGVALFFQSKNKTSAK